MKLTFAEQLAGYTATEIIAALRCPRATAYDWKDGRRKPPEWQEDIFIREIERHVKKARKKPKGG